MKEWPTVSEYSTANANVTFKPQSGDLKVVVVGFLGTGRERFWTLMVAPHQWPLKDHVLEAGKASERQLQRHSRCPKQPRLFQSDQLEPLLTNPMELA